MQQIILFDGVCHLCNHAVKYVIQHDPDKKFLFVAFQSAAGANICGLFGVSPLQQESVLLIKEGKVFNKSNAVIAILRQCKGWASFFLLFSWLPEKWRNQIYDWVAKNRYKWWGKRDTCMLPTPDVLERFL
jgi:predicted DCC family thiol-disulfide oxidoreductase YuxK